MAGSVDGGRIERLVIPPSLFGLQREEVPWTMVI